MLTSGVVRRGRLLVLLVHTFFSLRLCSIDRVVPRESYLSVKRSILLLLASAEKNMKTLEPKLKSQKANIQNSTLLFLIFKITFFR